MPLPIPIVPEKEGIASKSFQILNFAMISFLAVVVEGSRVLGFKLAAGEILFVINFSVGLRSRKLQTSSRFDGSLLKISFCSLSI